MGPRSRRAGGLLGRGRVQTYGDPGPRPHARPASEDARGTQAKRRAREAGGARPANDRI